MRRSRKKIKPRAFIQRQLPRAIHRRIRKRPRTRPILGRTIRIDDSRQRPRRFRLPQQTIVRAGHGIFLHLIAERKQIHGTQIAEHRITRRPRHRIAMIEAPAPRPGARNEETVEHLPTSLVRIESAIQEIAEKPPALGITVAEHARYRLRMLSHGRCHSTELEPRNEIADRSLAEPGQRRISAPVNDLIDLSRSELIERNDHARIGRQLPVFDMRERPSRARQNAACVVEMRFNDQMSIALARIGRAVRIRATQPRQMAPRRSRDNGMAHWPVHIRDRRTHAHRAVGKIELPAQPCYGEALFEHKSIAQVSRAQLHQIECGSAGGQKERTVSLREAAIGNLQQNRAPRPCRITRTHQNKIAGKLDAASRIAGRERNIGNAPARGTLRVQLKIDTPLQPLVRTRLPQRTPAEPRRNTCDLDAGHFSYRVRRSKSAAHTTHAQIASMAVPSQVLEKHSSVGRFYTICSPPPSPPFPPPNTTKKPQTPPQPTTKNPHQSTTHKHSNHPHHSQKTYT